MKLRIEIEPGAPEEVILRAPEVNATVRRVRHALEQSLEKPGEIAVRRGGEEIFLPCSEICYFEVVDDRVYADTADDAFVCPMRLSELGDLLPRAFTRASKSCVVNTAKIRSINRSPTGVSEASFNGTDKRIFISRMYYKIVREVIEETRLSQ